MIILRRTQYSDPSLLLHTVHTLHTFANTQSSSSFSSHPNSLVSLKQKITQSNDSSLLSRLHELVSSEMSTRQRSKNCLFHEKPKPYNYSLISNLDDEERRFSPPPSSVSNKTEKVVMMNRWIDPTNRGSVKKCSKTPSVFCPQEATASIHPVRNKEKCIPPDLAHRSQFIGVPKQCCDLVLLNCSSPFIMIPAKIQEASKFANPKYMRSPDPYEVPLPSLWLSTLKEPYVHYEPHETVLVR